MQMLFHVYLYNHVQEVHSKMKLREWLIKKLIGNKPVVMNVTIVLDEPLLASESTGIYEKCSINYTEKLQKELEQHANN